ncbi:MotA/TolQ/ExbB proton channel family protein [Bacillus sp. CGMCC 1.16541]|uniref:MotA/TolQ/ExbB proton channel family protein n=1 Tax=Bacillus sp. CGMCC 1.16541 TaxID=2185143 RepID=UPI000D731B32|nr:MotA/TolQ/ExbB proton channel family protein [Bacillus sp. CGMCC 1.16541]
MYNLFEMIFSRINDMGVQGFTSYFLIVQLGVFVWLIGTQLIRIRREMNVMKQLKDPLMTMNRSQGQEAKQVDFAINDLFESITEKNSKYKELWSRYYTRVTEKNDDERIRVEPFFGFDVMHYHMGHRPLMDVGAGISVSIGVLGTFIGLSVGLSELSLGDTDALRTGIGSLLDGMKVAFFTSVFGVFLSLIWIGFDRYISSRLDKEIDIHSERLDYLLSTDDEELFLNRLEKITRSQADHLKTLLTDALEKAMMPVVSTIQDSNQHITEAFGQLTNQFSSLQEGIHVQSKLLESQVELTKNNSQDVTERLVQQITGGTEETIANFSHLIQNTQGMQQQMMQTVQQVVTHFADTEQRQANTMQRTEKLFEKLSDGLTDMDEMRKGFKEMSTFIVDIQGTFETVQKMTEQQMPLQQEMMESNQALAQKYGHLSDTFSQMNEKVEGKYEELLQQVVTVSSTMSTTFKDMTDRFTKALAVQERSLTESDLLLENVQAVVAELTPLAPELKEVTGNIADLKQQLRDMQIAQTKLLPELVEMRSHTHTVVEEALTTTKTHVTDMKEQIEMMQQSWVTTKTEFEETRQVLSQSVKEFKDNIDAGLSKTYQHFDQTLTDAVKGVSGLINQFQDTQEDFVESMKDLSDSIERTAEVMKR